MRISEFRLVALMGVSFLAPRPVPAWVAKPTVYTQDLAITGRAPWTLRLVVEPGPGSFEVDPGSLNFGTVKPRVAQTMGFTIHSYDQA